MAMSDSKVARLLIALLAMAAGCSSSGTTSRARGPITIAADPPRRDGLPTVLVLMPESEDTAAVWRSLRQELEPSFNLRTELVPADVDASRVGGALERERPSCVVMMNNPTLRAYAGWQRSVPPGTPFPPALVVMASFLEEQYRGLVNTTGIAYEIPAVTVVVNLRTLVSRPVTRLGVVHRRAFEGYLRTQAQLAALEGVTIVSGEVAEPPTTGGIRGAVRELVEDRAVDALWVLNDNELLSPRLLAEGWMPATRRHSVPVIVGVGSLVNAQHHFGAFAVLPDHAALGVQAANLVFSLAESGWSTASVPVEQPLSVRTVVDLSLASRHFDMQPSMLERIDLIVK